MQLILVARAIAAWPSFALTASRNAAGNLPQARETWQQALTIFEDIQHPDAAKVSAKLGGLDAKSPPSREG